MATPKPNLRLPPQRMDQLKRIAEAKSMTVPEVVVNWIKDEIAKGTIADDIPGVAITPKASVIQVQLAGEEPVDLTPETAAAVAARLRELSGSAGSAVTAVRRSVAALEKQYARTGETMSDALKAFATSWTGTLGEEIKAARQGTGIKLMIDRQVRAFTADVARDVAEQLRFAATQAK